MDFSVLTPQHHRILDVLREHPTLTNAELGECLGGKSARTIENQLNAIYKRLNLDRIQPADKRRIQLILALLGYSVE